MRDRARTGPGHRPLAAFLGAVALLAALAGRASAHDVSEGQQRILETGSHLEYAQLGAVHMLTGYDHLLFLFGVMFFLIFGHRPVHQRLHDWT
jgi:hypothetical protein